MNIRANRSILNGKDLTNELLELYPLDDSISLTFFRTGIAGNDVYFLRNGEEQYVLKIYFVKRPGEQIERSIELMHRLSNDGINIPKILENVSGELFSRFKCPEGTRYAVIQKFIQGNEPDANDEGISIIGDYIGKLYKGMDKVGNEISPIQETDLTSFAVNTIDLLKIHMPTEREKIEYLETIGQRISNRMNELLRTDNLLYGICHGDLYSGNMIQDEDRDIYLIDFDACALSSRIYDISTYTSNWMACKEEELAKNRQVLDMFLTGFSKHYEISKVDRILFELTPAFKHFELFEVVLKNCVLLEGTHWITGCLDSHYNWFKEWEKSVNIGE